MDTVAGPAAAALDVLSPSQLDFIRQLPKAELHAHLNGSIPLCVLQSLARDQTDNHVTERLDLLREVKLTEIQDFFGLFPAIYALTSNPPALATVTRAVLESFLGGEHPQCTYLELRSTPRETPSMSRYQYVQTVLDEIERYPKERAAFIMSLDRRMEPDTLEECVDIAQRLKLEGRRVVGIDLCGDPMAGNMKSFAEHVKSTRDAGLGVTLHIAETAANTDQETLELLSWRPHRLGHATFMDDEAKSIALEQKMAIEICLSSNLLCKTVPTLDVHHMRYYLERDHPIAICTDDTLPFRTSLEGEYALLLAPSPLGLGLSEAEVERIAEMSLQSAFR